VNWTPKLVLGAAVLLALVAGSSESAPPAESANPSLFPVSAPVAAQKEFWVRVFARVSTSEVLIHDEENLRVYSTLRLGAPWDGRREQRMAIRAERQKHEAVLLALAEGGSLPPGAEALAGRLRKQLAGDSRQEVWRAAYSVRAQPGLKEKFREGYIRSGRYLPRFEAAFRRRGLPLELVLLPHIESGFEERAYSKARAVGMWQFIQPTGRLFMRVDGAVDGRRDPFISAEAAAGLLSLNHKELGTWPLALTAYNHGAHGMQRAVAALGTRDFGAIVKGYRGPHFGFASRNFYGEFLAAVHVHRRVADFFGPLKQDPPARFDVFHVPQPMPLDDLARRIGLPREALRPMNPALGSWVARGRGHVPRGYPLRVPAGQGGQVAHAFASGGARPSAPAERDGAGWAFVAPGDTLSAIASRHKVSVQGLMAANGLQDALIHPGDRLLVPRGAAGQKVEVARKAAPVQKKEEEAPVQAAQGKEGPAAPRVAVVARGDTLDEIARRHGVSVKDLMAANKLRGALIHPGDRLALPGQAAPAAKEAAPGQVAGAKASPPEEALVPPAAKAPEAAKPQEVEEKKAPAEPEEELRVARADQAPPIDWLEGVAEEEEAAGQPPVRTAALQLPAEKAEPGAAAQPKARAPASPMREEALREALAVSATGKDQIGKVHIQENETISHFAEWLEVTPDRLRRLNGLRQGRAMPMGREFKVPLDRVSGADLLERRLSYHRSVKAEFDRKYEISGTVLHKLAPRENVWTLVTQTYKVPLWLVRGYNPGKDLRRLVAGEEIVVPLVKPR